MDFWEEAPLNLIFEREEVDQTKNSHPPTPSTCSHVHGPSFCRGGGVAVGKGDAKQCRCCKEWDPVHDIMGEALPEPRPIGGDKMSRMVQKDACCGPE